MEITESQLAGALKGFRVRVCSPVGMGTSSAELANADETAKALFATLGRMAALREPDSGVHVTRKQLEDTLAEFCAVTGDGRVAFTSDSGTVADVARALYGQLAAFNAADRDPNSVGGCPFHDGNGQRRDCTCERRPVSPGAPQVSAYPELTAMAACMAAIDPLGDSEAGLSNGPVWRVLQYVAERYGYVLATED